MLMYSMCTWKLILPFEQASSCHSYMLTAIDISSENPAPHNSWISNDFKMEAK